MPPKKSAAPPPASDESDSDLDEIPLRKTAKKLKKVIKEEPQAPKNPDEQLAAAVEALYEGNSDVEDDNVDLFNLKLPPRPKFLTKPDNSNRLMILNVEVENFKSYFGKASIGPFHKSFTSIIGPNGSGKSNLIDSLLFVFGFRASKIRSAKVGNLVHKSAGRAPTSCTVTIFFQRIIDHANAEKTYTVVDNSKFTISRTAYINNSSSYAIDGRPASKTEVEARLRKVDIDIEHNRFLILQGEVEQIAMMKPIKMTKTETGMVEYLEDIIGSNRLEPYVKRFQRRVNRLLCEQSQQRIAREHARSSKVALEGDVRHAIEFLSKENETKVMKMKLDQRRRQRYLDKAAPLQTALDEATAEKKAIAEKLDTNKNDYKMADELEKQLTKDRAELDKKIDKLTKELNDLSTEETRRLDTLKRYEADLKKSMADKEKELKKKATLEAAPEKAAKKIEKLQADVEYLTEIEKTANEEASKNLAEFEKEAEKPKEEQKKLQEAWAAVNTDFNKIRTEASVATSALEDLKKASERGARRVDESKAKLAGYEEKFERESGELETAKPELERLQERMKRTEVELPALRNEANAKRQQYAHAREALQELRQQSNSAQGSTRLIQMLNRARDDGIVSSFKGRLGDMGYIDKKYDVCMSSNFAPRLAFLIIGDRNDSTKLIDFLHENQLPRSSVQPLDFLRIDTRHFDPPQAGRYPLPRLFDLIECDDELKPAFYDLLRETLVAPTVKEAQAYNKSPQCKGLQIATLCGSLVHPNGNVTGGGQPKRGKIMTDRSRTVKPKTNDDREAERHLTVKVEQLRVESEESKNKENMIDNEHMRNRREHAILLDKVTRLTASVQEAEKAIETFKNRIKAQEQEAANTVVDEKIIEEKQKAVEELVKNRDKLGEEASKAKARQEKVQEKLDEMFRSLVGSHRQEADDSKEKRQKMEKDLAKEAANIANSSRNIAKCEENIGRLQKDIDKKQKMLDDLAERAPDEEAQTEKKTAVEEMETSRKDLETQFVEMTKKRSKLSKAETELEEEFKKKHEEVMTIKERMGAHQEKVKEIEKSLSALKVNRIPRFQFLIKSQRPEELEMEIEEEELQVVDENQSPEEVEKQKKHLACVMSDMIYAMEFGMRQKVLDNTESYENVDGDKLIPIELLTEEKVREITDRDAEELQFKLKAADSSLEALKSKVDVSCIDTYIQKVKQFNEETIKMVAITSDYRRHNIELHRIKKMRLEEFHSAFEFIGKHLVAVYKMLTDGGDAKLEYIDKDDPFNQGISFMVRPAKKAWKQIQFLSGGEKTLSSLALIFALHMFRPTPFYVMDEIDAALDYRNVSIIAQYVRQKTENAQFIIISLRNNMFELANRLVGIYKVDGCTQNVAIDPLAVCAVAKVLAVQLEEVSEQQPTTPEEVTRAFQESQNRQNKEMTAQEKQYPNFPSSSEINMAEKIVSVEGRVRKQIDTSMAPSGSRPTTRAATSRPASTRPESRLLQMRVPQARLVVAKAPSSSSAAPPTTRTPRKERHTEDDDTTPPVKRSNSVQSPRKQSAEKSKKRTRKVSDEDLDDAD